MKIKKLELHNIASIENATIDFDQTPLSDTDLFLITGTTGAGKTTILDGISLALYNTTPRLAKCQRTNENANEDNLTALDPRNILRQNTGYGFSRLFFTGNDKKEYCAEWSVQRGTKRKVNQALSNAVWTITELGSGTIVSADKSNKYNEVEDIIKNAVGLDFHQFCRTTMLAQGEFTEFLKSDENDKAAILEKISGSDIYRRIGAAIYKQFSQAKENYDKEREKRDQIVVMGEDERSQKEQELQEIKSRIPEYQEQIDLLQSSINWLNEDALSQKRLNETQAAFDGAKGIVETDGFLARETAVQQWKETIEVRQSRKSARNELSKMAKAERDLRELESSFREALAGEAYLSGLQTSLNKRVTALTNLIEEQEENVSAYENSQTIIANINSLKNALTELSVKTAARKKCAETDIPDAKKVQEESARLRDEAVNAFTAIQQQLDEISKELEKLNLSGLRKEKDFLKDVETKKSAIHTLDEKIKSDQKAIAENVVKQNTLNEEAAKESAELARLEVEHERRKETINKFAKEMRSKLNAHLGEADNICPVCGQHVSSIQPDALLDEEFSKIKEEYDAQKTKAETASGAAARMANLITLAKKEVENESSKLVESVASLKQFVSSRDDAQKILEASKEDISCQIAAIIEQISKGEEVESKKEALQTQHTAKLNAKGAAEANYITSENAVKTAEQNLKNLDTEIAEKQEAAAKLSESIAEALEGSAGWSHDWKINAAEFIEELRTKTKEYNSHVNERNSAQTKIVSNEPVLTNLQAIKSGIMIAMPDWNADSIIPAQKDKLQEMWTRLNANVKSLLEVISSAKAEHSKFEKTVKEFLDSHAGYTEDMLDQLNQTASDAHEREAQYVNSKRNDVNTCSVQLEKAKKDREEHLAKRPASLKEEDTAASLTTAKTELDNQKDQFNERKGSLETELKKDNEEIAKKGDTSLQDQLEKEMEKWKRFNSAFGDAEGAKLCKIAQSFVLGSLLSSANHHLQNMAPRYRLLVTPGKLNLKLEDKYNGFATRSTNSISGGESFLVSLALALALADFGQHLGVSTLFIDEGFGTLSGEALQSAINTLKALHRSAGRQVGIISHREEIRGSIPVQIKVDATTGSSASTVKVNVSQIGE